MNLKRYTFYLLFLACLFPQFLWAQIIGNPYSGTMRISSDPIGEFNCTLPVDFTNPFTMRRAAWAATDEVNTFATPVVGDFDPSNGQVEVLILSRTRSNDRDPSGFDSEWKWINTRPAPSNLYVTRDIIVYTYDADGAGGLVKKHTIPTPDLNFEGPSPFLIAKVPGYPNPLVIVATSSVVSRPTTHADYAKEAALSSRLIAYDITSNDMFDYVWISSEQYGANIPDSSVPGIKYRSGGSPGIANFDLSGTNPYPAVYIYNEIFSLNPATSNVGANLGNNKVFDGGPNLGQGISSITQPGTSSYGGSLSVTVAADVIPSNNTLELICGNTVYEFDQNFNPISKIQLTDVMLNGIAAPDGFTSVANIDQTNGRLDIIVTTQRLSTPDSRLVYVYTIRPDKTPQLLAQKLLDDASEESLAFHNGRLNTGLAFVGDIDGNSKTEIGVTTPLRLWMLSYDGSPILQEKWPPLITNDESGHTLITMFDFNQDGSQELVYRDEKNLRIINGSGVDLVPNQPVWGATAGEGPVIADFNQDGEADIIVTDSQDQTYNVGDRYPREPHAKLVVFKSQLGSPWAPARSVWNQYAYFSFHVNDDLTIPAPQLNHGLEQGEYFPSYDPAGCLIADRRPFNSFLVQRTLYTSNGCFSSGKPIMDAKIVLVEAKFQCYDGSGTSEIEVTFTVSNVGDGDMTSGTKIEFSIGTQSIAIVTVGQDILPGDSFTDTIIILSSVNDDQAASGLTAEINPADGNGVREFPECNYDIPVKVDLIPRPDFTVTNPAAICEGGGSILIDVENNVSDLLAGDEVSWYLGDPSAGGTLITNGLTGADGAIFTIFPDFSLQIDDLPASPSPYLFYFVDLCSNLAPVEVEVKVDPAPNILVVPFDAACFGGATGRIEIGGHQSYITYSLDGGITPLTYDQLLTQRFSAGNYILTTIASINPPAACTAQFPFEIKEPIAITLTNKDITPPSCDLPNGSYSIDFAGGAPPYTLTLTLSGSTIESLSNQNPGTYSKSDLAPGPYSFTVTDANNCTISDTFILANDPKLPIGIVLPDQEFCEGQQAILNPVINTGGNPRIVNWYYDLLGTNPIAVGPDPNNGNIVYSFNGEGLVIAGLPAGVAKEYYVGVSGDLYCPVIEPVSISVLPPLTVSIVATEIICFGDLVAITATASGGDGNFLFSLNGGPAQSGNVFTGRPAGDYTVTVTSAQNCVATSNTITVVSPSSPISLQGEPNIIGASCNESNGIIQNVNVTGGWGNYTIEWRKDNSTTGAIVGNQLPEITGLAPGNYFLVVTDGKGCKVVFPFEVKTLPLPDLVIAEQTVCEGEDVTITPVQTVSGASPSELIWYKNAAATDLLVEGIDPGNSAITYTISDESELLIQGLPAGTYTYYLEVVCTGEIKQAQVVVSASPNPIFEKTDLLCFGLPTGKIKVIANSNPDFRYSLDGAPSITQANLEALDLAAGTYSITITQIGTDCSTVVEDIVIEQPGEMIFTSLNQDSPICGEDNGSIEFQLAGGVEDYSITINNKPLSEYQVSEVNNVFSVTELALGQYDILVTDANGCEVTGQFTLEDDNSNAVQSNNLDEVFCEGEVVILVPVITITGTVTPTFSWYLDEGLTQLITSNYDPTGSGVMYQIDPATGQLSVYNLGLGDENYFLEITDDAICAVTSRADVTVTIAPNPIFDKIDILCFGESTGKILVIANSNPDYRYSVAGAAPINEAALETIQFAAGTYSIVITESGSDCSTTEEITIVQPEELIITKVNQVSPACGEDNGIIEFQIAGGVEEYAITINNKPLSDFEVTEVNNIFSVTKLALGQYDIRVKDANGCEVSDKFTLIDDNPNGVQSNNLDEVFCEGEVVILVPEITVTGSVTPVFTWYLDEGLTQPITSNYNPTGSGVMYQIDPANGQLSVYNLAFGDENYFLEITDDAICAVSSRADVFITEIPSPIFKVTDILCHGESSGKIELVGGSQNDLQFSINGELRISLVQFQGLTLAAGDYEIKTFIGDSECPDTQVLTIVEPDPFELEVSGKVNPVCGSPDGSFSFTIEGGTPAYLITINNLPIAAFNPIQVNSTYTVENLEPGTYELKITDSNNCVITETVELENSNLLPISAEDMEEIICKGEAVIFNPVLNNSSGVNPSYTWYLDENLNQEITSNYDPSGVAVMYAVNAQSGTLTVYNLPAGDFKYYLVLRDDKICDIVAEAAVTVTDFPSSVFEVENIVCFGEKTGKIKLVSPAVSEHRYTVNGGPSLTQAQLENLDLAAGAYTIETKILNAECPDIQKVEITQPGELTLILNSSLNPTCNEDNGDFVFTISGGVEEYLILINGKPIADYSYAEDNNRYLVNKLGPGSYTITVEDANGCAIQAPLTVELKNFDAVPISGEPMESLACEGTPLTFVPDFEAGGVDVTIRWFRDEDLTQEILSDYNPLNSTVMYQIDSNTGELTVFNLESGTYTYYLQLSDPQICTLSLVAEGTVNDGINAEVTATPEICFGAEDGSISVQNAIGGSGKYEYSLDNNIWSADSDFENLAPGIYTVYIRDIGGNVPCTFSITNIEVEGPVEPIAINDDFVQINASCDLPNGSISNLEISGGWGNYSIEWRKGNASGPVITGDKTGATDLEPGVYVLLISDGEGCEEIVEFEILEQPKPDFEPIDPEKICEFSTATIGVINTISGSSSTDFTWSKSPNQIGLITNGADSNNPGVIYQIREELNSIFLDVEGLPAGSYTYYFFAECSSQEIPITIEVLATPEPVYNVSSITCHDENDGKITVISGGGVDITYTLDGGITFISQGELDDMLFGPGEYILQAKNELGCLSKEQILTIVNPEILEIQVVDSGNTQCKEESGFIELEFAGGTPDYTLSLVKDGQQVESIITGLLTYKFENLGVGSYQVKIIDSQGCMISLTSPLEIQEAPTKIIIEDLVEDCQGEIITLTATLDPVVSNPVFTWYWTNPNSANEISDNQVIGSVTFNISAAGQITITGLGLGDYSIWVEVTGDGVCEGDLKEVEISINPKPEFTAQVLDENCFGEGGSILIGSVPGQNLTFSLNGGAFISYPSKKIDGLKQGVYKISAKNEFGCITDFPDVLEIKGPQAAISITELKLTQSNCGLNDGGLSFQVNGGYPDYEIVLLKGNNILVFPAQISTGGLIKFENLPPANYKIQITDSKGCVLIEDQLILTDIPPIIEAEDVVICAGEEAVIQPELKPVSNTAVFEWYYDLGLSNPVINNGTPDQFGATYQISSSGEITATGLPARALPYSLFIAVDPGQSCSPSVKKVNITVIPLPTLRVSNPSIVCDPQGTVNLNEFIEGFNPNLFDYNIIAPNGSPMRLDEITAVNQSGNYIVSASAKGRNCFTPTQRISVLIAEEELIAEFQYEINLPGLDSIVNSDVQILEDIEFEDISQGDVIIWNWEFGDGNTSQEQNPVHQYGEAGEYLVKLTTIDRFGCQSEYQRVIVALNDYLIIIPNAFTPTNVKNTYFYPKYRGIASLEFYVFNTWGELIYHSTSLEGPGWDGTLNGTEAMNGNYVYRADFVTNSGEKISKTGVFILIR